MNKLFKKAPKPKSTPDYLFLIMMSFLIIFGLVMLTSASSDLATEQFGNSYYYLTHQIIYGLSIGIIGFLLTSFIYYHRFEKLALGLLVLNIIALILVFTPLGMNAGGASRWLQIGGFSFQPGEFLKLTFIIYLACWISKDKSRSKSVKKGLIPLLILIGIIGILLILQPATTIAIIVIGASVAMYFISKAKIRYVLGIILLGAILISLLIYITPYRRQRIMTFLNPTEDTLGSAYHINQSKTAIGSGGITGVGYGQSTTKLNYLPEPIGDSIFAVIGEELGFIGSMSVLLAFFILIQSGIKIAKKSKDSFGKLLVTGFITIIASQTIINIGAISGFFPLTGIPLPFISYGGTALATFMTMSGIIINISKYTK
jgi:cell division protein FtsW